MPKQKSLADQRLEKLSEIKTDWRQMYPRLRTKAGKDLGEAPALTIFRRYEDRLIKLTTNEPRDEGLHSVRLDWYGEFSRFLKGRSAQDHNHSIHPHEWSRVKANLIELEGLL